MRKIININNDQNRLHYFDFEKIDNDCIIGYIIAGCRRVIIKVEDEDLYSYTGIGFPEENINLLSGLYSISIKDIIQELYEDGVRGLYIFDSWKECFEWYFKEK